ncbi:dipeptidase [Paenibacillus sp. VMFN-D1]|uniref:dipeptidase n=1 Tax=Paenibacillus sp. VMFN-D1 TaxID=2135608 RepID=UPI000E26B29F|nr:dipeptidase [Paenibacillus sp. VMFN-D1]RED30658.1 membrane dipeptidase [Paenibacillus sp. VMFN-D1]
MTIFDAHCDVLSKLLEHPQLDFAHEQDLLDVTLERMQKSGIRFQNFAVYLPEKYAGEFRYVLESIDLFHERVLASGPIHFIRSKEDLEYAEKNGLTGALLSLEGVDALQGNLAYVRILHHLGVRSIGITWNYANWAADGVMESRRAGLTEKGRQLIQECNRLGMILDVSHLSEKAFWELASLSAKPLVASHSNAGKICPRRRNLSDEQIGSIIRADGVIGVTFVPPFVHAEEPVTMDRLLAHIDHICSLGGRRHIGLGSDFDGIREKIIGLEHAGKYHDLVNLLQKHYSEEDVEGFICGNWYRFYLKHLPAAT